jgi:hypothetical protein
MSTVRKNMANAGYSQEDAYFFEKDQELIKELRFKNQKPKLELIQGGKRDEPKPRAGGGRPEEPGKKRVA